MLVVSDGQANDDDDDELLNDDRRLENGEIRPGVLKNIINAGIVVDAIGVAMKDDHPLATQINGEYRRGDDLISLTDALDKSVTKPRK